MMKLLIFTWWILKVNPEHKTVHFMESSIILKKIYFEVEPLDDLELKQTF